MLDSVLGSLASSFVEHRGISQDLEPIVCARSHPLLGLLGPGTDNSRFKLLDYAICSWKRIDTIDGVASMDPHKNLLYTHIIYRSARY